MRKNDVRRYPYIPDNPSSARYKYYYWPRFVSVRWQIQVKPVLSLSTRDEKTGDEKNAVYKNKENKAEGGYKAPLRYKVKRPGEFGVYLWIN